MKEGKVNTELLISIPEEFRDEYKELALRLESSYQDIVFYIISEFNKLISTFSINSSKDLGLFLKSNPSNYSSAYFELLKGKPIPDKLVMSLIRPHNNSFEV